MQKQIHEIIDHCLSISLKTENNHSLSLYFHHFKKKREIKRIAELDQIIFLRMYGRLPSSSEVLKVRYWRCGHHLPANRTDMIRLGFALCLTPDELNQQLTMLLLESALHLLDCREFVYHSLLAANLDFTFPQAEEYANYYVECYHRYKKDSEKKLSLKEKLTNVSVMPFPSIHTPVLLPLSSQMTGTDNWKWEADLWMTENYHYFDQTNKMQDFILHSLCRRYLVQIPQNRLDLLHVSANQRFNNLRHILFCDILDCLYQPDLKKQDYYKNHTYSLDFSSEINRYFKSGTKLSRITLIRLLLIFTMPDIDINFLNELLILLGYAPLNESLHTASGARTDSLVIRILEIYETYRSGNYEKDRALLTQLFSVSDQYLSKLQNELSVVPAKGSLLYKKQQCIKDLKIMAFHSLRKGTY